MRLTRTLELLLSNLISEVLINLIYVYSSTQQAENAIRMCGQVLDNRCNSSSLEVALKSEYTRHNPVLFISY